MNAPSPIDQTVAEGVGDLALPFLKMAGGKRKLVPYLLNLEPVRRFLGSGKVYHEPFVGGGAFFWALAGLRSRVLGPAFAPRWAILGDTSPELINAYLMVRDRVEELVLALSKHRYEEAYYYGIRAQDPKELSEVERAARFLFLNKTCFNGLARTNRSGQFNVPFGRYTNPTICDAPNLRACSLALQGVEIHLRPFEDAASEMRAGDLAYFDPPYLPISKTSSFTAYTSENFRLADHERLRDLAMELARRNVRVVLSNSTAPAIEELYQEEDQEGRTVFVIHRVQAERSINSKAPGRGKIGELVITTLGEEDA